MLGVDEEKVRGRFGGEVVGLMDKRCDVKGEMTCELECCRRVVGSKKAMTIWSFDPSDFARQLAAFFTSRFYLLLIHETPPLQKPIETNGFSTKANR